MNFYASEEAKQTICMLEKNGLKAYYIGTCVLDNLLRRKPNNYEIATNGTLQQILNIFSNYSILSDNIKYETVTVLINQNPIKITTYCTNNTYIEYCHSLYEYLQNRAFTINAMAFNDKIGLIDFFDGIKDINDKQIRCIDNAEKSFQNDAIKILYALRFSSEFGFKIEKNTSFAIHKNKNLLKSLKNERIASEFNRIICGFAVEPVLLNFRDVISTFIPEYIPTFSLSQNNPHHIYDVYTHICKAVAHSDPILTVRLALAFHDIGKSKTLSIDEQGIRHFYNHYKISAKMAIDILTRLHYDKETIEHVRLLILYHDISLPNNKKSINEWINQIGPSTLQELMLVKKADTFGKSPKYFHKIIKIRECESLINHVLQTLEN